MSSPPERNENQIEVDEGLYVEPFTGWRCWRTREHPTRGLMLTSYTYRVCWPIRKPMRARCLTYQFIKTPDAFPHTSAPDHIHGCGIYSVMTEEQARRWAFSVHEMIVGKVNVWGKVTVFTEGYLAEYAYVHSLVLPTANADLAEKTVFLAERYGVEIIE